MENTAKASWRERYDYGWQVVTFALSISASFFLAAHVELKVMRNLTVVRNDFLMKLLIGIPLFIFATTGYEFWKRGQKGELSRKLAGGMMFQIGLAAMVTYLMLSQFAGAR